MFRISAQNIDCRYFLSRNKKNHVYLCKPKFSYIKVGFKGVKITKVCFPDVLHKNEVMSSTICF